MTRDSSETRGGGKETKKRDKKKKGTNITEKESRPSRGDRFPLVLFAPSLLRHLFFSSRAGKSISSLRLRQDRIRYAQRSVIVKFGNKRHKIGMNA